MCLKTEQTKIQIFDNSKFMTSGFYKFTAHKWQFELAKSYVSGIQTVQKPNSYWVWNPHYIHSSYFRQLLYQKGFDLQALIRFINYQVAGIILRIDMGVGCDLQPEPFKKVRVLKPGSCLKPDLSGFQTPAKCLVFKQSYFRTY